MVRLLAPEQYVERLYEEDAQLAEVLREIRRLGMPEISIAPGYGRLLTLLVRIAGAAEVLEIGALGGYSGICLCRGLGPEGRLLSLELREDYAEVARRHLEKAGFGGCAEVRVGDAKESLRRLAAEGRRFDLVFIDADKESYPHYLEAAIGLGKPGTVIVADNVLLHGRTADPSKEGPSVAAMRLFNETIARDPRLDGVLLPSYDGLAVARIR